MTTDAVLNKRAKVTAFIILLKEQFKKKEKNELIEIEGNPRSPPMQALSEIVKENDWECRISYDTTMPTDFARIQISCDVEQKGERVSFKKKAEWKFLPPDTLQSKSETLVLLTRSREVTREESYPLFHADTRNKTALLEFDSNIRFVLDEALKLF